MTDETIENNGGGERGTRTGILRGQTLCAVLLLLSCGCAEMQTGLNDAFKGLDDTMKRFGVRTGQGGGRPDTSSQTGSAERMSENGGHRLAERGAPLSGDIESSSSGKTSAEGADLRGMTAKAPEAAETAMAGRGARRIGDGNAETAPSRGADAFLRAPSWKPADAGASSPDGMASARAAISSPSKREAVFLEGRIPFGACKNQEPSAAGAAFAETWWKAEWETPATPQMVAKADLLYAKGEQVAATNGALAVKCFKAAAKGGCIKAQERMGMLHYPLDDMGTPQMEGVPANIILFRKWMELAAEKGSVFACEVLGAHWYAFGDGARSKEWWRKAQSRGSTLAGRELEKLQRIVGGEPVSDVRGGGGVSRTGAARADFRGEPDGENIGATDPGSFDAVPSRETVLTSSAVAGDEAGVSQRFGRHKNLEPSAESVEEAEAWWAAEWAEPATSLEISRAGKNYEKGEQLFETDEAEAVKYIRRAAKGGSAKAQERMAQLHYSGGDTVEPQAEGIPANVVLYRKWMELAAEQGSVSACEALGEHWQDFGNAERAKEWREKAQKPGGERAASLPEAEQEASGILPDVSAEKSATDSPIRAEKFPSGPEEGRAEARDEEPPKITRPAPASEAGAGASRFGRHKNLEPSAESVEEAEAWWAAEWAEPATSLEISRAGRNYEKGEQLFETDEAEAVKYIRRAAKGGSAKAQERMALLHYSGGDTVEPQAEGIPANVVLYRKWMELAAEQGSVSACEALGEHWQDFGNAERAKEWREKAQKPGGERAASLPEAEQGR